MKPQHLALPALLLSMGASANTLNVYTYDSFTSDWGPGPAIKTAFEAECDCTLNWVALEDGVGILNRLRLEGSRSKADVILGLDNNLMSEAKATGLVAPLSEATKSALPELELPEGWNDSHFVPFDFGHFAFIYNSETLAEPPTSMEALIESDLTILYQDPRTSTPGLGLMLWIQHIYGDQAGQAWQQLSDQTVTVTKGWSEAYGMFLEGEADLVLSYTTSPAYHLIAEKEDKYKAAMFDEGHYLQVEVAARAENAPNPELAEQFLQFITQAGFQDQIPTGNWMLPVKTYQSLPQEFEQLNYPEKTRQFSSDEVAEGRKAWVNQWLQAVAN